jgi:ribosomal protein L10
MPKNKIQKDTEVKKIKEHLASAKSVVFTSYDGLKVSDSQKLRGELRKENVAYLNSLLKSLFIHVNHYNLKD